MTEYLEAGIRLIADVSDAEDAIQGLIDQAQNEIVVSVTADTSDFDSEVASMSPDSVDVPVSADTAGLETDITDAIPAEETVDITPQPQVAPDGSDVFGLLQQIRNATVFSAIIDVAGPALDFFKTIGSFSVGPMLELDTAMATMQAQTGAILPGARELITKLFGSDLGDSVTQISQVVTHAQQLHDPLEAASTAALDFTKVFPNNDPTAVLDTLDSMVKNNLVPDFQSGADLLVAGMQQGADKGGDLLSVLGKNSSALKDLGLTGPSSLQLITNALQGGADSATSVVMELEKIKTNITSQVTSGSGAALNTLATLGIPDPITSGQGWSASFFLSVSDAIKNAPVDDATKQQMFQSLVGGKLSQKDYEGFLNLDAASGAFTNLTGTAATAAANMDNSLTGAVGDFEREVQTAATNFLSSDQIDLPGKIQALKTGIQDGLAELQKGGSLQDAFTIALKPVGLDQTFEKLEASILGFVISLEQAFAKIQFLTGDTAGATATMTNVSVLAGQKLTLDLEAGNLTTSLSAAAAAKISTPDLMNAVTTAINNEISQGNMPMAQAIADSFKGITIDGSPISDSLQTIINNALKDAATKTGNAGTGTNPVGPNQSNLGFMGNFAGSEGATAATNIQNAATNTATLGTNAQTATQPLATMNSQMYTIPGAAQPAAGAVQNLATQSKLAYDPLSSITTKVGDVGKTATPAAQTLTILGQSTQQTTAQLVTMNGAVQQLGTSAATINASIANSSNMVKIPGATPGTGHASGTSDTGVGSFLVGENGPEIVTTDKSLAVLNNKTVQAIMSAVSGAAGRGFGGGSGGGNKSVAITNINNVQSDAQADVIGWSTAKAVRGLI